MKRNIPLKFFTELAQRFDGISFVSLQKGVTTENTHIGSRVPIVEVGPDFDTTNGAFADTAAIMMNLDLVISSDSSVPHLAGALGVPIWVALPFSAEWRWLLDRSASPWYPTMRLFRQSTPGDWHKVFSELALALGQKLEYLRRSQVR